MVEFEVCCEWGRWGIESLGQHTNVFVIVDVLSFSTCIDIAVNNGATVFPYRYKDDSAAEYARALNAILAGPRSRSAHGFSLSPASLLDIPGGTRLVLPSPNGATLSLETGAIPTLAGCLRNAEAVARVAQSFGSHISLIPAGERIPGDNLRFAIEDLLGAGAIIAALPGTKSPEARLAELAYRSFKDEIERCLKQCPSGQELIDWGFERDVELAAMVNTSACVPLLKNRAYVRYSP